MGQAKLELKTKLILMTEEPKGENQAKLYTFTK